MRKGAFEVQENHARKLWAWMLFQAILPCVVVFGSWLAASELFRVHLAFEKTFVGADLVLVGAMLLITLLVDIWAEQRQIPDSRKMVGLDRLWLVSAVLTFVAISAYGILKAKSVLIDFPASPGAISDPTVSSCIRANILVGLCALVWAAFVAVFAHRRLLESELAKYSR